MITSVPNLLTLSRIAVIPLIVALFFVEGGAARWGCVLLFSAAAITDYFDGWLARRWGETSNFGRFLDPIADKLLVVTTIVLLIAFDRMTLLTVIPAVIIVCREIVVSGLREFLAALRAGLPVSVLAKWKTAIQMVALGILIAGDAGPAILPVQLIGEVGLWIAGMLTIVTGYDYLKASAPYVMDSDSVKSPKCGPTDAKSVDPAR